MAQHPAKTVKLPAQYRDCDLGDGVQLRAGTANEKARTVELVWSTGARVRRNGLLPDGSGYGPYIEELSMDAAAVDLSRMNNGAPLLNAHMRYTLSDVIGVIVDGSARITKGIGTATAKFSARDDVDSIFQDVLEGVIRNVSVGYTVSAYQVSREDGELPVFTATKWTPFEVSAVPIGADYTAGFRSEDNVSTCEISFPSTLSRQLHAKNGNHESENIMDIQNTDTAQQPVTQNRAQEIRQLGTSGRLSSATIDGIIDSGVSVESARAIIINKMADECEATSVRSQYSVDGGGDNDPRNQVQAMAEAIAVRYIPGVKPSDHARTFSGASLLDMAQNIVRSHGQYHFGMSKADIVDRAMGTTDFPGLLLGTGDRILRAGYDAAQSGIKPACSERTADDFRALTTLRVGGFPALEKVGENGEVKHGGVMETKESFKLDTYAKIIGLTRQAIINDDLNAFGQFMLTAGKASAQLESSLLYNLLISNPTMTEDNKALFHTDHNNLAGTGTAITVASLGAARKALRTMTTLDGTTPINAEPAFLLVGPEKETEAEQILATISAAKSSDANPFSNKLQLLVEPRFGTSKEWYVLASPSSVPTIEYAYLSQAYGPQLQIEDSFKTLGMNYRVLLDFGAGIADWRGAYKNPGA